MEIRCEQCGHLGAASEVRPIEGAVGLVCAHCGHLNTLHLGPKPAVTEANPPAQAPPDADVTARLAARLIAKGGTNRAPRARTEGEKDMVDWVREHALDRLVPPPGEGLRCRKCANIYSPDQAHCGRCGLAIEEGHRHAPGQAPWERPVKGQEEKFEQARLLWESATGAWSEESVEKFIAFARDADLIDAGIRKLQFRLVDHPDDPIALDALSKLARGLEARIIVARGQAQASAEQFQVEVVQLRKKLLIVGLGAWLIILLFFSMLFWDKY